MNITATLLHYANASPPHARRAFYAVKDRLLRKYARFTGHQIQEIRKECWGPWNRESDCRAGCLGEKCPHCRGTGVYDIRWVRLERWQWGKYVFHIPAGDTRTIPSPYPPDGMIRGRIEHANYGRKSHEALLWLYLLCGEWRLLWRSLTGACSRGWYWWPLLNVQRVAMNLSMFLSWRKCFCGRWYPTWGSGWCVCRKCRSLPDEPIPF
jgi:hypothetical protein